LLVLIVLSEWVNLVRSIDLNFMKRGILTFIVFVFATLSVGCQVSRIDNLELLGRLWGFLKYHHPAIGQGQYDWDAELFRFLPGYLEVTDLNQRDQQLLSWIKSYGEIPVCATCKETPLDAYLKPDLDWIRESNAGRELKSKVEEIYQNRHQGKHHYIELAPWVMNPVFTNEKEYSEISYPDQRLRLLALYRYWNMVHYYYPSKYLTDKDWDTILREYIPVFLQADSELAYELAALRLITEINDSHAASFTGDQVIALKGDHFAPCQVQFVENKLVVTDFYYSSLQEHCSLKVGDVLTQINGISIETLIDSLRNYYPASNDAALKYNIAKDLLRSGNSHVDVKYIRDNQELESVVTLYDQKTLAGNSTTQKDDTVKCFKLLDERIGYITLETIREQDVSAIKEAFHHTEGIIIDIRNYPSAFVPFLLGSYFVMERTPFVKFTRGNPDNPGEFTFLPPLVISPARDPYPGKLIVIVNETSISQAEYTAMAFKAGPNTTIVGSTTAGADGNISPIILPGGLKTHISGLGVYYPNGTRTQRVGIVPDVFIEPTIEGIKSGRDEVLEKAIEVIRQTGSQN